MKITTSYNNLARGQADHDLVGRFDLPIYTTSAAKIKNFITNFKGCAIYRSGWERMIKFEDCAFVEFNFNEQQNYLCVFYNTKIRFLTYDGSGNFGWVLSGGTPLEITSPYSLQESKEIQYARNADTMYIVHPNHAPRKLTRTGASSFTLTTFTRTNDPFTGANKYPSCITFYGSRLFYASTNEKITTIFGSKAGSYDDHSVSSPIVEGDALEFTLADISEKIQWLSSGENSLIAGARDGLVAVNGGGAGEVITAKNIEATPTSADGAKNVIPIRKDGIVLYVGKNARNIYSFSYDILKESFEAPDANIIAYDVTNGKIKKLRWKKDRNDIVYCLKENGKIATLNYNKSESIIGWHEHESKGTGSDTIQDIAVISNNEGIPQLFGLIKRSGSYYIERKAPYVEFSQRIDFDTDDEDEDQAAYTRKISSELRNCIFLDSALTYSNLKSVSITFDGVDTITALSSVFSSGDVGKHIVYKTVTGYEYGRFEITGYTSGTEVTVEVLITPTVNTYTSWYLTFNTLSGLSDYVGTTISVVTDGGYYDDVLVPAGGTISIGSQTASVVVGYKYKGLVKTFPLGFASGGSNTQVTLKNVSQIYVRTVNSAGGYVGTSNYKLQQLQELTSSDLNYLPPLPMSKTTQVDISDVTERDKCLYIVQKEPLPFVVNSFSISANYVG